MVDGQVSLRRANKVCWTQVGCSNSGLRAQGSGLRAQGRSGVRRSGFKPPVAREDPS